MPRWSLLPTNLEQNPLNIAIHKLTLNSVADDRPMSFHATLQNAKPPGEIRTDGQFGPLRPENVGHTVLSGSYTFQHADLGVFPGIAGTLSSTGKFNGVLEHIEVEGSTDAPNFQVTRSNHAVHLKTQFHANVNGMDGDVALGSVHAQFERTSVASQGEVAKKAGSEGKTVSLGSDGRAGPDPGLVTPPREGRSSCFDRSNELQSTNPGSPREARLH